MKSRNGGGRKIAHVLNGIDSVSPAEKVPTVAMAPAMVPSRAAVVRPIAVPARIAATASASRVKGLGTTLVLVSKIVDLPVVTECVARGRRRRTCSPVLKTA